jgi:GGDEF domain-containing protein
VTVSAGIASLPGRRPADVELIESLGRADAALYEAKEAGRDRVALAA